MLGWAEKTRSLRAARPLGSSRTASWLFHRRVLGGFDLDPEQLFEELGVAEAGSGGLASSWAGSASAAGRQLEVGKMAAELLVERVWAHRRLRFCWSMCRW